MDSAAYLLPVISQITQLFSTSGSVIILGHTVNVPLMWSPSELIDGLEPHALFLLAVAPRTAVREYTAGGDAGRRCTRGGAAGWVPGGWYTGY